VNPKITMATASRIRFFLLIITEIFIRSVNKIVNGVFPLEKQVLKKVTIKMRFYYAHKETEMISRKMGKPEP